MSAPEDIELREHLEDTRAAALAQLIGSARWFGGKGRPFRVSEVSELGSLDDGQAGPVLRVELVTVTYDAAPIPRQNGGEARPEAAADSELYQLPLVYYLQPQEHLAHASVGQWDDPKLGPVHVYDALQDREVTTRFVAAFDARQRAGRLVFHRLEGHALDVTATSMLLSGEQSNSSLVFGDDSLLKVFRKVTPGPNPDIEIHEALTRVGNEQVAALYGWLEATSEGERDPLQLAMLQQFLRTASDGWALALASVRDLFAEGDLHADEVGGDFAGESHRLGAATALVHEALATQFPTSEWGRTELAALASQMRRRLEAAIEVVPELAERAEPLAVAFAGLAGIAEPVVVQRIHGDYHLGQTLRTVKGWKLVDFEGEPAKPLPERLRPDSAWRDVAGMLRSLDYAAHSVEVDVEEGAQIAYRADEWVRRNQASFLQGYLEGSGRAPDEELSWDEQRLVRAYQIDKAVYETVYEARNRPSWLPIPLSAIERLTRSSGGGPDAIHLEEFRSR